MGEAKLEVKDMYESLGLARERIEIVCWDRDRVGSEYMGEVSLSLEDWWGNDMKDLESDLPPVGFSDETNKVRPLSSRRPRCVLTPGHVLYSLTGTLYALHALVQAFPARSWSRLALFPATPRQRLSFPNLIATASSTRSNVLHNEPKLQGVLLEKSVSC